MDGPGGGCCIARYATGGVVYDASKFDRIMLGFRPIAPKPASCGSSSGRSSPDRKVDACVRRTGRGRRRRPATSSTSSSSDKTNKGSIGRKRQRKSSAEKEIGGVSAAVVTTLPLLPEEAEIKNEEKKMNSGGAWSYYDDRRSQAGEDSCGAGGFSVGRSTWVSFVQRRRVVETWVTVESVTDTWMVERGLGGRTDEQKRMALMGDTSCPGMISDGLGRVIWTNHKFRQMVGCEEEEVAVWLVVKDGTATLNMHEAFTCRVRVQYRNSGNNKEKGSSVTLPCDVWRMEEGGGGFAWRLDLNAALSLGPRW